MQATASQADTARRLAIFVRYLVTTYGRDFVQALDELDLSLSQVKLLTTLADGEDLSVKAVSDQLGLSLPAVSRAVDGLLQRGLVTRAEDAHDRRVKRVGLSRKGRALTESLTQLRLAGLESFVGELDARERDALERALELLGKREELR